MRVKFLILFLLCSVALFAQDIIVQNNGNTILSKVVEIGASEVKYKKFSNLNGPTYTIAKAEILVINYENGEKESFANAQASVVNTNNIGKRMLSDNELLRVDANNNNVNSEKIKRLKRNGWIVGLLGVGIGTGFCIIASNADSAEYLTIYGAIGGTCILGGAIYAGVNFIKANRLQKELDSYVHVAPIFQENIKFDNGSMLSAGVDFIKGKDFGYTPGVGLRYNF